MNDMICKGTTSTHRGKMVKYLGCLKRQILSNIFGLWKYHDSLFLLNVNTEIFPIIVSLFGPVSLINFALV